MIKVFVAVFVSLFTHGQNHLFVELEFSSLKPRKIEFTSFWTKYEVKINEELKSRIIEDEKFVLYFESLNEKIIAYQIYPTGAYPPLSPKITFEVINDIDMIILIDYGRLNDEKLLIWKEYLKRFK